MNQTYWTPIYRLLGEIQGSIFGAVVIAMLRSSRFSAFLVKIGGSLHGSSGSSGSIHENAHGKFPERL